LKSFYFLGAGLDPARLFGLGQNWSGPRFTGTVDVNCNSCSTVHLWTVELSWRRRRTRGRVADHLAWRWWLAWGGRPEASGGVGSLSWLEWLQLQEEEKEICREERKEKVANVVTERRCLGGGLWWKWWFPYCWWWLWLLKVELEEEMVTVLVSCGGGRKKKKQKKKICSGKREEGWFFGFLWTRFSPHSSHQRSLYL